MEAYDLGYSAFLEGREESASPYTIDSVDRVAWRDGWSDAAADRHSEYLANLEDCAVNYWKNSA